MEEEFIIKDTNFPKALTEKETEYYTYLAYLGDNNAKEILKEHNLRFVSYIVRKHFIGNIKQDPNIDYDDLVNIGVCGLIKAIETFDINKNIKLAAYAKTCIMNEILFFFLSFC